MTTTSPGPATFTTTATCRCGWTKGWRTRNPEIAADDQITLAETALAEHVAAGKHIGPLGLKEGQ